MAQPSFFVPFLTPLPPEPPRGPVRCSLPSADSACALVNGDIGALPEVVFHTALRGALIATGVYAAGERRPATALRYGIGGALAIEVFVLGWTAAHHG